MASIRKEVEIDARPEDVWDALREVLIDSDDEARRLVWSVVDGPYSHHNGAALEQGVSVVKKTLEG